jgi:hypothetical protein
MMGDILDFAVSTASFNAIFDGKLGFYDNPDTTDLADLITSCGLTLGSVGNFNYIYEIDFVKQTLKVWRYTTRWVNAPENWKEKGWVCWLGDNGRYGYTNWVKGKLLFSKAFFELVSLNETQNAVSVNKHILEVAVNLDK